MKKRIQTELKKAVAAKAHLVELRGYIQDEIVDASHQDEAAIDMTIRVLNKQIEALESHLDDLENE